MAEIIGSTIIDDTKGILDEMKIFEATRKATKHRKKKKKIQRGERAIVK